MLLDVVIDFAREIFKPPQFISFQLLLVTR